MKYRVRHVTTYKYTEPVRLSHHAAHLHPRGLTGQSHSDVALNITPTPAVLGAVQTDYFGNPTVYFTIQDAHSTLEVDAQFVVETSHPPALASLDITAWDRVAADLIKGGRGRTAEAQDFLYPSPLVPNLPQAYDFAKASFPPGRPLTEAVMDLTARIHTEFKFDPEATLVGTPLEVVFEKQRGVCQDFAHAIIACIRSVGLAARYVSGYIRTMPPPGKEKLMGADASHAWASVFLPGWGWLDVDPTNNCICGEDHVTVAWGRDYDDVSPIRGVVLGGGNHHIKVAVDVIELT